MSICLTYTPFNIATTLFLHENCGNEAEFCEIVQKMYNLQQPADVFTLRKAEACRCGFFPLRSRGGSCRGCSCPLITHYISIRYTSFSFRLSSSHSITLLSTSFLSIPLLNLHFFLSSSHFALPPPSFHSTSYPRGPKIRNPKF